MYSIQTLGIPKSNPQLQKRRIHTTLPPLRHIRPRIRPRSHNSRRIAPRAKWCHLKLQLPRFLRQRLRSTVILLDVEPTQQHDRFIVVDAAISGVAGVDGGVGVDAEDTAAAAEAVVEAAEVDGADAELAQGGGTHDAGLDGYVEVGFVEDRRGVREEDVLDGDEFSVTSSLL